MIARIKATKVSINDSKLQGYRRDQLWDNWQRYLPPVREKAEPAEPAELDGAPKPNSTENGVPDQVPGVPDNDQRGPQSQKGENGLKAAETLGPVPRVPEVPDFEDVGECPRCDGEGCEWCLSPPIEQE